LKEDQDSKHTPKEPDNALNERSHEVDPILKGNLQTIVNKKSKQTKITEHKGTPAILIERE
jgi:hypothetical protein